MLNVSVTVLNLAQTLAKPMASNGEDAQQLVERVRSFQKAGVMMEDFLLVLGREERYRCPHSLLSTSKVLDDTYKFGYLG